MSKITVLSEPRQLAPGAWKMEIRDNDKDITISGKTKESCLDQMRAKELGLEVLYGRALVETFPSLIEVIVKYLEDREEKLAAMFGPDEAESISRRDTGIIERTIGINDHFTLDYMDYQSAMDIICFESKHFLYRDYSLGLYDAYILWDLICKSIEFAGYPAPEVVLPKPDFLTFFQVEAFLEALKGQDCELAVLLYLHGPTIKELNALKKEHIHGDMIHVRGSMEDGVYVPFTRDNYLNGYKHFAVYTILTSRICELAEQCPDDCFLVTTTEAQLKTAIRHVCKAAGVPVISLKKLRCCYIVYNAVLADVPLRVCADSFRPWALTRDMYSLYEYYQIEDKMQRFDEEQNTEISAT